MHLLTFLDPADKIHNANDIDSIVWAQLPDPVTQPLLYDTITTCMLHGPCGTIKPKASCMADKKCSKQYPKEFRDHTALIQTTIQSMPDPIMAAPFKRVAHYNLYNNRDVIPYNPYLAAK